MKTLFVYIFTLLLLLLQGKTTSDITGRWETLEKSSEGLRRILQFDSDGSFTNTAGVTFKGTYKLQGNQLFMTDSSESDSEVVSDTQQISINENTLIFKLEGTQMEGIRLSPRVPDSQLSLGDGNSSFPLSMVEKQASGNSNSARTEILYPGSRSILRRDVIRSRAIYL